MLKYSLEASICLPGTVSLREVMENIRIEPVVIGRKAVGSQILGLGVGNGEEGQMLVAKMPKALRILETASPREIERQKAPGQNF